MILLMVLTHCHQWIGWLKPANIAYFSGAAGLVFLSGIAAALGYSQLTRDQYWRRDKRIWKRLTQIWAIHVGLALVLLAGCYTLGSRATRHWPWSTLPHDEPFFQALLKLCSMVYQPNFMDVLPIYFICLLMTPWLVRLIESGKHVQVFAVSVSFWLLAQGGTGLPELVALFSGGWLDPTRGAFNLLAWQLLFVSGLLIGMHKPALLKSNHKLRRRLLIFSLFSVTLLHVFKQTPAWYQASEAFRAAAPSAFLDLVSVAHAYFDPSRMANKATLSPLLLFNCAAVGFLVWQITERFPYLFSSKWMMLIGRYSLFTFGAHILMVYCSYLYTPKALQADPAMHIAYIGILCCSTVIPPAIAEFFARRSRTRPSAAPRPTNTVGLL